MRKNAARQINDKYYQKKGYKKSDLSERSGKPKRALSSFQCEVKLWDEFDKLVEKEHGTYKKSYIIESLIREYMTNKKKSGCSSGS